MNFTYPQGMHFPQKYYHNRPQGSPHEKEFELFSNKNKCYKNWNQKEDGVLLPYFSRFLLDFL